MIDFEALNAQLLQAARDLLPTWLPGGRWRGREWVCGSIQGGEGDSFSVNSITGKWAEFNGGATGGDLVSLYADSRGMGQREAALELGATDRPNGHAAPAAAPTPADPLPGAPPTEPYTLKDFHHYRHGAPSAFWVYRSPDGAPLFVVARYDLSDGKQIVPWTFRDGRWQPKGYPKPRPLYGLDNLPPGDSPVLIVEGEKTADAAQVRFPEFAVLTWCGGALAAPHADWTPLSARNVTIWPDNDDAGCKAAATVSQMLLSLRATVSIVDPSGWPDKWDIADASPEDDLRDYAAKHVSTVAMPEIIRPEPKAPRQRVTKLQTTPALTAVTKLQTTPAPTAVTIAAPAALGSLYAIYDQYQFGRKSNGRPHCNEHNVRCAIRLKQFDIYFNDFEQRICLGDREWDEAMTFEFMEFLQHDLEMSDISLKTVRDGITGYAFLHRRNPIQDWLRSLTWDGEMRLPDLLFRGFGTPSDEYSRAVGRCFIVGMVARVMRPGCKADCMPVFEGDQGLRKSTALGIIGGKYFSELHDSIMSKDFYISLQGKMLCEISELHAFKTADIERIKGIISNAVDRFRAPYASISTDHPRQGVFAGTTNRDDWNTDETGARRFWPVLCGEIDIDWLIDNREQLFAEAMVRLNDGEPWWDVPKEQADREREARQDSDPWEDVLAEYLRANNVVRIPYIMDEMLKIKLQDFDMLKQRRIGRILRRHGFKKLVKRDGDALYKVWERKRR